MPRGRFDISRNVLTFLLQSESFLMTVPEQELLVASVVTKNLIKTRSSAILLRSSKRSFYTIYIADDTLARFPSPELPTPSSYSFLAILFILFSPTF